MTKSEWTKGHNQWRKPLNFSQERLSKISRIICQVNEERQRVKRKKLTGSWGSQTVVTLGMHVIRKVTPCRWATSSRRFEASSYLHLLSVKKSTNLEDEGSTILRNAAKPPTQQQTATYLKTPILQHSVLVSFASEWRFPPPGPTTVLMANTTDDWRWCFLVQ
jgi:hypothetical protein